MASPGIGSFIRGDSRRLLAVVSILTLAGGVEAAAPSARPNIVLILVDDEGFPHFNFMEKYLLETHPGLRREDIPGMPPPGVPLVTPNMDRLAATGALFPYAMCTAPVCMPSLQGILTGLNPRNISLRSEGGGMLIDRTRHKIMPQLLTESGYATLQTGKWWEGDPAKWGLTENTGGHAGADLIGRQSMDPIYDFVHKYHLDPPAEEKKPFFVWFAPKMPHVPHAGFPDDIRAMYPPGDRMGAYHAMITWLDRRIGELMGFLEENGLRENTLILFLNDNGNFLPRSKNVYSANGIRTPFIVNYPGVVPAATRTEMVSSLDLLPTMLDYAGAPIPEGLDGLSLRRLAEGKPTSWRRYLVNHMYNGQESSIWNRDFTLYLAQGKVQKLYDLRESPFEDVNLALPFDFEKEWSPVTGELRPVLEAWWNEGTPPPLDPVNQGGGFLRGDANLDAEVDLSDAVTVLDGLFAGGQVGCQSAADANDDDAVDLSDAIRILFALFGGETLPAPFPGCGADPTPDARLTCGEEGCPGQIEPVSQSSQ